MIYYLIIFTLCMAGLAVILRDEVRGVPDLRPRLAWAAKVCLIAMAWPLWVLVVPIGMIVAWLEEWR